MSKSTIPMEESRQRFKAGSTAFFEMYPDFIPGDIDYIEFEEHPRLYHDVMQFRKMDRTRCVFKWRKMTPDEFVDYTLKSRVPMELGKFLVPEIAEYLGFTINHLNRLKPVTYRLDKKHKYEKIIFDSYIQNGGFFLTQEQRDRAYHEYKESRL